MERSILKNRGKELFCEQKEERGKGSINRVTRYDIFIINHNASIHDPSAVFKEYSMTKKKRERKREARKRFYYFQAHRETALCSPIISEDVEKWKLVARSRNMGGNEIRGYSEQDVIGDDLEKALQKQDIFEIFK